MANLLRVMITDEDPDSRVTARRAMQRAQLEIAGETGYGTEAVSFALQEAPDFIFIAVEEPAARALETAEALANSLPDTPIVIYSSAQTPDAIRRGMVFGARDYLAKPLSGERVQATVERTLALEEQRQMRKAGQLVRLQGRGTVVTVAGAKGGVGKSVVSVNLATALHQETGRSVLVIDADTHFGDVATMLDLPQEPSIGDLLPRLDHVDREAARAFVLPHHSGIDVLAGPADELSGWADFGPDDLRRVIDLYAQIYDFLVVDTSGAFDAWMRASIESAGLTVLVTSADVSSIRDTARAVKRMDRWDVDPDRVRFVLNRNGAANGISVDEAAAAIGRKIFWEIPFDKTVPASVQVGQPAVLFGGKSVAARGIVGLARRIAGVESPSEDSSLWRRVMPRRSQALERNASA